MIAAFEPEEQLAGGNTAESVVRLGSTVRKPVTPSTAAVHSFLQHIRAAGIEAVPAVFGLDQQGRQILEYVPGSLWHHSRSHSKAELRRVGGIIQALHQAAVSFQVPKEAQWNRRYQLNDHEIICHNDLAPWNLVCGPDRWTFIDWDAAAPATRLWDLAWSSISFPLFEPECDLGACATAMHALLNGYGLGKASYGELIKVMVTRARAEHALIVEGAAEGRQPWLKLHAEGHDRYWGPVANYIDRNASVLESLLICLDEALLDSR